MHLIQILLPLYDNEGHAFGREEFERVRQELVERFGGMTAFLQSPASGVWKEDAGAAADHDKTFLVEVMVETLDREWWSAYRVGLEHRYRQAEIVLRAIPIERL